MIWRSKRITKKQVILSIIAIIILVAAFFCGCTRTLNNSTVKKYLESKYNREFTYVREETDESSLKICDKIFVDSDGNEVKVRYYDGEKEIIGDNYYSIMYDSEIQTLINNEFDDTYKIFAITDAFTHLNTYNSLSEYLGSGVTIYLTIYTTNSYYNIYSIKNVVDRLAADIFPSNLIDFIFAEMPSDIFDTIEGASGYLGSINAYTMKVKNGETIISLKHE